jgi:uncharacterized protein YpuA (DUF1002 family)
MSTTKNNSSVNLTLTEQQVNLIIESLLFSSSVNIGAEWNETDLTSMIDTAKSLKEVSSNIELDKLVFYKEDNYEDKWTKDLLKYFKKNLKTLDLQKA